MLVNKDPAFSERDPEVRGLNLKDETFEGDGVVVAHGAFFFDGKDQIKIDVRLNWDKSRTWLLGFYGETLIELTDKGLLQEKIGSFFGFDAVQTKFVRESALKCFIDALTAAPGLRGIRRNRPDAQVSESSSDLS